MSNDPVIDCIDALLPVVINLLVSIVPDPVLTVIGNVLPSPLIKVIVFKSIEIKWLLQLQSKNF